MKTKSNVLALVCLIALLSADVTRAQTVPSHLSAGARRTAAVTFNFRAPVDDYSVFPDENGEGRYYLQVPADNVPTYKVADAPGLKVMVDNEKSDEGHFVFWIPVRPGTTPRVERRGASLVLIFVPPDAAAAGSSAHEEAGQSGRTPATPPETTPDPSRAGTATPPQQAQPGLPSVLVTLKKFEPDKELLAFANEDLAVPESPAFTVLGLTPETVVRPSSPREFASSFLSGVDSHGNFQSGLALDVVPYWVFAGNGVTLGRYNSSYKVRLLSRTQFSFANTKGASDDDKSVRLALGLRMTLWDDGDPHSDKTLMDCFGALQLPGPPAFAPPDDDATPEEMRRFEAAMKAYEEERVKIVQANKKAEEKCRADARKRNWNNSSWVIAAAPSWISQTGESKNFKWNGAGFWTTLAYGFGGVPKLEDNSQLLVHARYRNNEQVPDADNKGQFLTQDSVFIGGRWRYGNERVSANFESVYQRIRQKGKPWDDSARYSVGLERKIAENIWFALAFGGERGRDQGKNQGFVLSSFRWGFSQKRTIPELNPDAGTTP